MLRVTNRSLAHLSRLSRAQTSIAPGIRTTLTQSLHSYKPFAHNTPITIPLSTSMKVAVGAEVSAAPSIAAAFFDKETYTKHKTAHRITSALLASIVAFLVLNNMDAKDLEKGGIPAELNGMVDKLFNHVTSSSPAFASSLDSLAAKFGITTKALFTTYLIVAINVAVFLFTHNMSMGPMYRNFSLSIDNLRNRRFHTLLTSCFTHAGALHLFVNMMCLWSFSGFLTRFWSIEKFWAWYLSTGVLSGALAMGINAALYNIGRAKGRLFNELLRPCVGASSIICAMIAFVAMAYPHLQLSVLFLPFSFEAGNALPFLVGFDVLGILWMLSGRSTPIGHSAHFSGYVLGYLWYQYERRQALKRRRGY